MEYIRYNDKANILNHQFCLVFTCEDLSNIPTPIVSPFPDIPSVDILVDDIITHLSQLQPHKASGPDGIPSFLLKMAATEIAPCLALIFQASICQKQIPVDWKHAHITPIFKKGCKSDPTNYRPISLTCTCCKILEKVIHSHITAHLSTHNILCDQQHGFRKHRSCESQLIQTVNDFSKALDKGKQIDAITLDFSKAFDKVPHHRLLQKLHHDHYGIRANF